MREGLVLERGNVNHKSTFDLLVGLFLFKIEVKGSNLIWHGNFFISRRMGGICPFWAIGLKSNKEPQISEEEKLFYLLAQHYATQCRLILWTNLRTLNLGREEIALFIKSLALYNTTQYGLRKRSEFQTL